MRILYKIQQHGEEELFRIMESKDNRKTWQQIDTAITYHMLDMAEMRVTILNAKQSPELEWVDVKKTRELLNG